MIILKYSAIDGAGKRASFKGIASARRWAHKWVGATPELGTTYAISGDGIGKIEVLEGVSLADLFGPETCRVVECILPDGHEGNHKNANGYGWYNRLPGRPR